MMKLMVMFFLMPTILFSQQYVRTQHGSNIWLVNISGADSTLLPTYDKSGYATYGTSSPIVSSTGHYFLSSWGNNGYNGLTLLTPKRTLKSMDTLVNASISDSAYVFLEGGSKFKGIDGDGILLNRGAVYFGAYNLNKAGKSNFPILSGTEVFDTGWSLTGASTYQQNIANTVTISVGSYAYIYVIEVDTLLEKTAPLSARHYMNYVPSVAAVDTVPGSYFCPLSTPPDNPTLISIHTSNAQSPNNNPKYRYEVVVRDRAIYRPLSGSYGPSLSIENLFAMDYAQGPGPLSSAQDSFYVNRCIVMGNAIHMAGAGNYSTFTNSGFIAGDRNIEGTAVIFYAFEGKNETNTVSNSIFLDQKHVLYAHTNQGVNGVHIGKLDFHNNYVFNVTAYVIETPIEVDTVDINFSYAKNTTYFLSNAAAKVSYIHNSVMEEGTTLTTISKNVVIDNVLYRSAPKPCPAMTMTINQKLTVTNSIFHMRNKIDVVNATNFLFSNNDTSERIFAVNNIFVGETVSTKYIQFATTNTYGGAGTSPDSLDYNAYIIVSGIPLWQVTDPSTNGGNPYVTTFAGWKTQSGQDQHSIFIDLRNYEGDLRRIFVDPDAGNYNLTTSPQADSIRTLMAGMRTPPGTFANTPSREQIVDMIQTNKVPSVSDLFFVPNGAEANKVWNGTGYTKLW